MNHKATFGVAIVAVAVGTGLGWWLAGTAPRQAGNGASAEDTREILYWVAPMDANFRRDQPGKSPMGMDLVPVYADEAGTAGDGQSSLRINPAVINNIGVKTAPVERATLNRTISTVGSITPNEHRVGHVHVRTEGWIERLTVHTEGARVEKGDVLFEFFAPGLVSAQDEFVQALATGRKAIIDATRQRLLALGLLPGQIARIGETREVQRLIEYVSPQSGYVMALNVRHGMYVTPALMVMSIADLSEVWIEVDVFENQIDWVEAGQTAHMKLSYAPGREWTGEVDYVYPTVRPESRTARVRLAFDNPDLVLKPNMYAEITIDGAPRHNVVQVPSQAVIRAGNGERVILALGEGRFRPAQVRTGLESEGRVEIVEGLAEGEKVVVSSQFLIDSEASLDASLLRLLDETPEQNRGTDAHRHQPNDGGVKTGHDHD